MLEEKQRKKLIEILERKKAEAESQIAASKERAESIVREKETYEKGLTGRGTEAAQDMELECAYVNQVVKNLEKINSRIEALKEFRFNAVCPECKGNIDIEDLLLCPLMVLCSTCQREVNGRKRK